MPAEFMNERINDYATCFFDKSGCMDNYAVFIHGTVIGIARPDGLDINQRDDNGHKRKNAVKFRAITSPDG